MIAIHSYVHAHSVFICRKLIIHLECDRNVPKDSPDFKFDGEIESFEYVSVYKHMSQPNLKSVTHFKTGWPNLKWASPF